MRALLSISISAYGSTYVRYWPEIPLFSLNGDQFYRNQYLGYGSHLTDISEIPGISVNIAHYYSA